MDKDKQIYQLHKKGYEDIAKAISEKPNISISIDAEDAEKIEIESPKGDAGKDGENGKDGKTPTKGVDYFTKAEVEDITRNILKEIPKPKDGVNGKDAIVDYERINKFVKQEVSKIPKPKDGIDGFTPKIDYESIKQSVLKSIPAVDYPTIYKTVNEYIERASMPRVLNSAGPTTRLGEISDVDTTGITNGQVLAWNGTKWVATTPSGGEGTSIGGTITGGTTGSVLFVKPSATIAQDNANFFWDDTNNRLGIGTATPETFAHVHGPEVALTSNGVGTFVISTPFKNSLYKSRMFFGIDNTTNTSLGTGFIQMRDINGNTNLNLYLNPNGGGVAINASTVIAGISEVPLLIGANPSNNGYIRLQNTSSYGGGSTPYTGLLFQQSTGTLHTYIKAGIIFNGYDGSGFARGQLLFALDPTASSVNVQNTLSTSTRMNIDYVEGVVTIGQGVTVGTGKLNVLATTGSQLRLYNTTSNYFDITVSSTGSTTFGLTGTTPLFTFSQGVQAPNIGIGTAPLTSTGLLVAGSGYTSNLIAATGSLSPTAGTNATLYRIAGTIVEAGSGTHNLMSAMFLGQTTVTAGAATVNNTASLYIENAMTATVTGANYAIWVDDGISRFDGKVILDDTLRLKGYLVANLPAGTQGDKAFVTNALAPTYLATVVGGGAIVTEVFYNGTGWVCT